VKPVVTQYALKDIFNMDKAVLFYNAHLKRTLALKGKCLECVCAPRCLKGLKHYPCYCKCSKNVWMTGRLFPESLVSFERKMACQNRNVLVILDKCAAHHDESLTLKCAPVIPTAKHNEIRATTGPGNFIYCTKRAY
jgi:hypothetical protein